MTKTTMWVREGSLVQEPLGADNKCLPDKVIYDQLAMVRITTDGTGTTIQWSMACPNWASLMLSAKLLAACVPPRAVEILQCWLVH